MSLSQDPTFSKLKKDFVCGTFNIVNQPYCGQSEIHPIDSSAAVFTTNGAGPHNIQMFVLDPDGTVLTCLPGFWESGDLAEELSFAQELDKVYKDPKLTMDQKKAQFSKMHLDHIQQHSKAMVRRSKMQGFDMKYEAQHRATTSDTVLSQTGGDAKFNGIQFKTTDVIMHERMAKRPFVKYADFDVATFCDYGRPKYDKNEDGEVKVKKGKGKRGGG